jgi:hypothetical protein
MALPPPLQEVEVDNARNVAGDVLFKNGQRLRDCRMSASMAMRVAGSSASLSATRERRDKEKLANWRGLGYVRVSPVFFRRWRVHESAESGVVKPESGGVVGVYCIAANPVGNAESAQRSLAHAIALAIARAIAHAVAHAILYRARMLCRCALRSILHVYALYVHVHTYIETCVHIRDCSRAFRAKLHEFLLRPD